MTDGVDHVFLQRRLYLVQACDVAQLCFRSVHKLPARSCRPFLSGGQVFVFLDDSPRGFAVLLSRLASQLLGDIDQVIRVVQIRPRYSFPAPLSQVVPEMGRFGRMKEGARIVFPRERLFSQLLVLAFL
ncbi:MAG: hypothetical protein ACOC7K_01530, partial [bacterium]